jgi:nanoRNase/pAp phosphatase (c-di-AMP/oligoRNAs hydrolase)
MTSSSSSSSSAATLAAALIESLGLEAARALAEALTAACASKYSVAVLFDSTVPGSAVALARILRDVFNVSLTTAVGARDTGRLDTTPGFEPRLVIGDRTRIEALVARLNEDYRARGVCGTPFYLLALDA